MCTVSDGAHYLVQHLLQNSFIPEIKMLRVFCYQLVPYACLDVVLEHFIFIFQASELASSIQSQRGLGCQASQVVHLEEGVDCDGSLAKDFWGLLGGRTQYRG